MGGRGRGGGGGGCYPSPWRTELAGGKIRIVSLRTAVVKGRLLRR